MPSPTRPPMPDRLSLPVGVVGAGLAGLAAAHALGEAGVTSVAVEKSRGVGGRAATRWRDVAGVRWRVDHGAQVFTPEPGSPADRLARSVIEARRDRRPGRPVLVGWDAAAGRRAHRRPAAPGLRRRLRRARPVCRAGHARPRPAPLHDCDRARPRRRRNVDDRGDGRRRTGHPPRAVPGHRADTACAAGRRLAPIDDVADGARAAPYRAQFTVVLAFDAPVALPAVPTRSSTRRADGTPSRGSPTSRASRAAPRRSGLLVAQMSDAWTPPHYDADHAAVVGRATEAVEALVGPLPRRLWTDTQRWRYSLPDAGVDAARAGEVRGLYVAGDAVAGRAGRTSRSKEVSPAAVAPPRTARPPARTAASPCPHATPSRVLTRRSALP